MMNVRVIRSLRCVGILSFVFVSSCAQLPLELPSPTHTSKPPTDEFAGLRNFGRVTKDIWRGAQPTASGYRNLVELGKVKSFLSLRRGTNPDEVNLKVAKIAGVQCFQVAMKEWNPGENNLRQLALAMKTLKKLSDNPKTRPVYVHCQAGRNRTGFVIATYRMVYQGWTADEAIREMRAYHFYRIYSRDEIFLKNLDVRRLREMIKKVE